MGVTPALPSTAWLAEGKSVRDMAEATGHTEGAIYWHLKQIYRKQSISRQADLVRLVLSLADSSGEECGGCRRGTVIGPPSAAAGARGNV